MRIEHKLTMVWRLAGLLGTVVVFAGFAGAAPAFGAGAWWHLTSGAAPSVLQPGQAQDEVQELTVSASEGDVFLAEPKRLQEVFNGTRSFEELIYAIVPYNASVQEVQEAFQRLYPSRRVLVSQGSSSENTTTYVVTFPGQSVPPAFVNGFFAALFGGSPLGCQGATGPCSGEASITELSKGRPDGEVLLVAANMGDTDLTGAGTPVRIADMLPAGLRAVSIEGHAGAAASFERGSVECAIGSLSCTYPGMLPPFEELRVFIGVTVNPGAKPGEPNEVLVSGGNAPSASVSRPVNTGETPSPFGVANYEMMPEEEGGGTSTQAGSHPFQLTTTLDLNRKSLYFTPGQAKDLYFKLPPGLIGNPVPLHQCTLPKFVKGFEFINECPNDAAVGVANVTIALDSIGGFQEENVTVPLFNLTPSVGEPARFGFMVLASPVLLDTSVRTGGDYGVTVSVKNITQVAEFLDSRVTFWGVPGDPSHDNARGWSCIDDEGFQFAHERIPPCTHPGVHLPPPFLELPTSCTGPLQTSVEADSWQEEDRFSSFSPSVPLPALDGCNDLPFTPSIRVAPDGGNTNTPTGLTVDVHLPQEVSLDAEGLGESDVKNTTVALPEGVALSPSASDGLAACSVGQIALSVDAPPSCPDGSKVGTVEIDTPLLPNALTGAAYLAQQNANPFGSLFALYVVAQDPVSGTLVKLAGEVVPDERTGQLVSSFKNTPQLPFEDFKIHFFGGARAPLTTPPLCGSYTTRASIEGWSANPPSSASSTFAMSSGQNGAPCFNPLPFGPELTAGSTNIQAGAFTPFTMTMSRADGNQNLDAIQLKLPPGLLGTLANVKLCPEPQASEGLCGPESLIGETTVSVGLGGDPYTVRGGRVYITGPYAGAAYGLSIVNPAKAGPFDLGKGACDCVVVRAKIEVDPVTAALTVTSDTTGSYRIPEMLDGVPLEIKHVNVTVNRQGGFTFNPTDCEPMQIGGALTSSQGATSQLHVPFQVTNCATLGFKPIFKISTSGKTSRANGASLNVGLSYPKAPWGSQANVGYVKVSLPKQLPSRLETLKKACPDAVFNQDPAACPPASRVGSAIAITPVIPEAFRGPAYFVSHGGAKFPELVIVLSGSSLTVQIHGETFITKQGITTSTFHYIPDVPVGNFELHLPQGPYSALAANGNLCASTLRMPTAFIAQNGMNIKQQTPITVTGCPKHKTHKSKHKKHKHKHKKK